MYYSLIKNVGKMFNHPLLAFHFYVVNLYKFTVDLILHKNIKLIKAKSKKKTIKRIFLLNDEFNELLKRKIIEDEPFFVCRYGNSEFVDCVLYELYNKNIIEEIPEHALVKAKMGPGVFPKDEQVFLHFSSVYKSAIMKADYNAYWGNVLMEEYLLSKYLTKECKLYAMRALEPFQYEHPWTSSLEGRKVLIISPMSELILQQYEKRDKLFMNNEILPSFDLKVVTSIQSSGNTIPEGYKNWSEALDHLIQECDKVDFEIALLSCGSYAVPLAAYLKEKGKKAIVLGGMLQLMFGIKGKRWEESRPDIVALYNENWIRQGEKYKVKDADKMVDGPAYW